MNSFPKLWRKTKKIFWANTTAFLGRKPAEARYETCASSCLTLAESFSVSCLSFCLAFAEACYESCVVFDLNLAETCDGDAVTQVYLYFSNLHLGSSWREGSTSRSLSSWRLMLARTFVFFASAVHRDLDGLKIWAKSFLLIASLKWTTPYLLLVLNEQRPTSYL